MRRVGHAGLMTMPGRPGVAGDPELAPHRHKPLKEKKLKAKGVSPNLRGSCVGGDRGSPSRSGVLLLAPALVLGRAERRPRRATQPEGGTP